MEEEKNANKKKGTDFVTLICFLVFGVIVLGVFLGYALRNEKNDFEKVEENQISNMTINNKSNTSEFGVSEEYIETVVNEEDDFNKNDIAELIGNYDSSKLNYFEKEEDGIVSKYFLIENNSLNIIDCIHICNGKLEVYTMEDGKVEKIFSKDMVDESMGVLNFYELEPKNNGNNIAIFFEIDEGDGLCYEHRSVFQFEYYSKNIILNPVVEYFCDEEEESRKREGIEENSNLTEEEKFDKLVKAHTLEYFVEEKKVSKEEYEEYKSKLNDEYILLFKTDENIDFFDDYNMVDNKKYKDMPYVFTKEKYDNYSELLYNTIDLPFVNIKAKNAEIINEKFVDIYEKAKANINEYNPNALEYMYYIDTDKNIIKIVFIEGSGVGESTLYYTRFYISIESGNEYANKELLNQYGINEKNIKQEYDKMIKRYYTYIMENKESMVYREHDLENVSFDDFYKSLKVFNKNTKQYEEFKYENINDYELDFDVVNDSFVINNMTYKEKSIGIDGMVMFSF